jgi:ssDNA-binding Zn-finger/Zn-ribbon topoisomerase 1
MTDQFDQEEAENLAAAIYRDMAAECPRCGRRVNGSIDGIAGRRTQAVSLLCNGCGTSGHYDPREFEDLNLEWTPAQKAEVVNDYRQYGAARCPEDGAILKVMESNITGVFPAPFRAHCRWCGRRLSSRDVE